MKDLKIDVIGTEDNRETSQSYVCMLNESALRFGSIEAGGKYHLELFNLFDACIANVEIANTLLELSRLRCYKTLIHTSSSEAESMRLTHEVRF